MISFSAATATRTTQKLLEFESVRDLKKSNYFCVVPVTVATKIDYKSSTSSQAPNCLCSSCNCCFRNPYQIDFQFLQLKFLAVIFFVQLVYLLQQKLYCFSVNQQQSNFSDNHLIKPPLGIDCFLNFLWCCLHCSNQCSIFV